MVWRRSSVAMALILGPAILMLMLLRNWQAWAAWPFWIDDLAAGAMLAAAGAMALRDESHLRGRLVGAAFGVAAATLWASLFEDLAGVRPTPDEASLLQDVVFALTGLAFLASAAGLGASLPSAHRPFIGTRPADEQPRPQKRNARR